MEKRPHAVLLKFPGTNCDEETARALRLTGFETVTIPFSAVMPRHIFESDAVVLPGGYSYGDYIRAGQFAQMEIRRNLGETLMEYKEQGGLILGICNGFQILTRLGLLPGGSLIENSTRRFMCQWVRLKILHRDNPYLAAVPDEIELPIAHREGRFVARQGMAEEYMKAGLAPLVYRDNVNGSACAIAGLQDSTGRVFGLMPHPERFYFREDHYDRDWAGDPGWGWGHYFFKSMYGFIQARRSFGS